MKKKIRVIIFLFILMTVSACGSKFMYNLIDTLIVRSMDRYFDLNGDQKRFLKERLEYKLARYRTDGIPEHIAFIKEIQNEVQKGLDEDSVSWFLQALNKQVDLISNQFSDDIVDFFMTLQDEQIDYFENKLIAQNEKRKKEEEKVSESETEDIIRSLEKWLGPFDDSQKNEMLRLLQKLAAESKQLTNPEQEYNERLEGQHNFISALRNERKNKAELKNALYEFINPVKSTPEDESGVIFTDYILKIDQLITQKQRNHFIKKLDGWVGRLEDLIDS